MYHFDYKNFAFIKEDEVERQVAELSASHVFDGETLRLMEDCHAGKGCVVGTALTYTDKIVPNIVGVDIACRVSAFLVGDVADLEKFDEVVHQCVPSGHSIRTIEHELSESFPYEELRCWEHIKDGEERYRKSLGTMGGNNHFIALERSNSGDVYLMIHCGTRNLGLQVANYYQNLAVQRRDECKEKIRKRYEEIISDKRKRGLYDAIQDLLDIRKEEMDALPARDLCYIEGQDMEDYLHDMDMLVEWSRLNHRAIAEEIVNHVFFDINGLPYFHDPISSIHNYVDTEHHVIRKGAIAAYEGEYGLIPMNMADGTLIVRGKGCEDRLCTAPHGAGRIMSRSAARATLDMDAYEHSMEGVYSTCVSRSTIDEAPQSYKPMDAILSTLGDTVEVVERLRPIYNFKAKG